MVFPSNVQGVESGRPVRFYEGCEADFDGNGFTDVAMLVNTSRGVELIVIMKNMDDGRVFLLFESDEPVSKSLHLSCQYEVSVDAIVQVVGENRKSPHTINANVIEMVYPEGAAWIYFWKENGFSDLWLSD